MHERIYDFRSLLPSTQKLHSVVGLNANKVWFKTTQCLATCLSSEQKNSRTINFMYPDLHRSEEGFLIVYPKNGLETRDQLAKKKQIYNRLSQNCGHYFGPIREKSDLKVYVYIFFRDNFNLIFKSQILNYSD